MSVDSDEEDGKADSRTTSRGQRYTLEHTKHRLGSKLVKRADALMHTANTVPGAQKDINQIINSCVSRKASKGEGVAIKARTVNKFSRHVIERKEDESNTVKGWFPLLARSTQAAKSSPSRPERLESLCIIKSMGSGMVSRTRSPAQTPSLRPRGRHGAGSAQGGIPGAGPVGCGGRDQRGCPLSRPG